MGLAFSNAFDRNKYAKTIRRFGATFPRSDAERAAVVESDPDYFEECGSELWDAMKADDYETIAEAYYKSVCDAHAIPPKRYGR